MWFIIVIVLLVVFTLIWIEWRDMKLLETVTNRKRGTRTERDLVLKLLRRGITAQTIFHDLYVKNRSGHFSQIDLVVATKVGIIVVEVKDYNGWIFGSGHTAHWTQVLAYGKRKYRFYNPIMQNNNHIIHLKKQLRQLETVPFYSIVAFYGNCQLKEVNCVPNGTFIVKSDRAVELIEAIMNNNELARYANKGDIVRILKEAVRNGADKETQLQHIYNVREMQGKYGIAN